MKIIKNTHSKYTNAYTNNYKKTCLYMPYVNKQSHLATHKLNKKKFSNKINIIKLTKTIKSPNSSKMVKTKNLTNEIQIKLEKEDEVGVKSLLNTENNLIINHPWFIYPNGFMSEYNNYKLYRSESHRLLNFINELNTKINNNFFSNTKLLIPIILGSTMEDALLNHQTENSNSFQYSQLYPNYINNFIKCIDGNKYVQIIIISPDNFFSNDKYVPIFTRYVGYEFVKKNTYEYEFINNEITIKINIFNCPMVCVDDRQNVIAHYDDILLYKSKNIFDSFIPTDFYDIKTYKQNNNDKIFIDKLYLSLENLFELVKKNNYWTIINSWVNFKNISGVSENYKMFPHLLKLASKYDIIATEWKFIDNLVIAQIISNCTINKIPQYLKYIYYINDDLDFLNIDAIYTNLKFLHNQHIFKINFSHPDLIELFV